MNGVGKGMILFLMILYIVSQEDVFPNPIDDLIELLIRAAIQKEY